MKTRNPLAVQKELIKEVHCIFENIEPKIIGRIFKVKNGPNANFAWEVNYYCKLSDEVDFYIPSAPYKDDLIGAERQLMKYIERFENGIDYIKNDLF